MVEKAKTEQLVSQMLPKKVVEDLKHGRAVEPESFECVTIFFRYKSNRIYHFLKISNIIVNQQALSFRDTSLQSQVLDNSLLLSHV